MGKSLKYGAHEFPTSFGFHGASRLAGGGRPPMKLNLKKGALHRQMGISQDEPIPAKKLAKAANSDDETLRKRAQFAINAKKWHHG